LSYAGSAPHRFLGRWLKHGEGYPDWTVRHFSPRARALGSEPVHERSYPAPVLRLRGDLLHDSAESWRSILDKQNRYTSTAG